MRMKAILYVEHTEAVLYVVAHGSCAVRTPKEGLHSELTVGEKDPFAPTANRICFRIARGFSV